MSESMRPDEAEQVLAARIDDIVPSHGYQQVPVVALGGSAGSIEALQAFFSAMPPTSGVAFVVVIHLPLGAQSMLAELIQRCTRMPVEKVAGATPIEPGKVYVLPPGHTGRTYDGVLVPQELPPERGTNVAVDIFFRTLGDTHGPHAAAVVLSGADGDGAVGLKRVKERGGLTVAQDPDEALQASMPRAAIGTGMVDWVLPVADMPARLLSYFRIEADLVLPPEDPAGAAGSAAEHAERSEAALRDVLNFLRTRTGRDITQYKRGTVLRRIAQRMQVNGVDNLGAYLNCLRTRPGESGALLHDLLISVTNFFRDPDCFAALEAQVPALFAGKGPADVLRVWVVACATGEEAYSVAMLLSEYARTLEAPPLVQIFATDLDEDAVRTAREGVYPDAIVADVSEERLRRFFVKEHQGWRVRRELRELVLFAVHDVLRDSPFSRLDLVTCRNLLIYLTREAQGKVLDTLHFALQPQGRLLLGSSEAVEEGSPMFAVVDKKHRIYAQRPTGRAGLALPGGATSLRVALEAGRVLEPAAANLSIAMPAARAADFSRSASWGDVHLHLLEQLGPPSVLIDGEHEILHLSASAGRFLQLAGGEPSRSLLRAVPPALRVELRAALYQVTQSQQPVELPPIALDGKDTLTVVRVVPMHDGGQMLFLVMFDARAVAEASDAAALIEPDPLARHLDREIERLKLTLRDTVEQYEASTEELKASNEELQAMNEELRAATEELETSREELQSINEELTTVNQELKSKVEQLSHANSDMHNLMDATAIATIFLDRELRITRYTPSATSLFKLIPSDVGRPLTDMASQLAYPELGDDARRVLDRLVPVEREVGGAGGRWFMARLLPYRTLDDRIAGVVFTFIDITERKQAEEMRLWLAAVVNATSDAIISFSLDGTILSWNGGAERLFGYSAQEAIGQPLKMLAPRREGEQRQLIGDVAAGQALDNVQTVRRRKDGSEVHVALTASPVRNNGGRVLAGTAIVRDITASLVASEALRRSEERLRLLLDNAVEYAIFSTDLQRRVTYWNTGAERLLGFAESQAIGQSGDIIFTAEDRAAGAPEAEARQALAEGRAQDERDHVRQDGSRFRGSGIMMPMRSEAGEAIGFVKILRDLSRH